jgi:hypothetical protein
MSNGSASRVCALDGVAEASATSVAAAIIADLDPFRRISRLLRIPGLLPSAHIMSHLVR